MIEVKAVKFIEKISKIKTFIILLVSYYCVFFLQKYADINELFTFVYIINIVKNVIESFIYFINR